MPELKVSGQAIGAVLDVCPSHRSSFKFEAPRTDEQRMSDVRQALAVPGFWRLAGTYWANELADWLATIALSVLVYDATRDPLATTALFVCTKFLPAFVVPALTARLDGRPAARVLTTLYVALAAGLAVLAASATAFVLPVVLVCALVVGTLASTARAFTRAANVALLEPSGHLREGNAALNLGFSAVNAAGPLVAGALVALVAPAGALVAAAIVFALEAVVMAGARLTAAHEDATPWRVRLLDGFAYVRDQPMLRTLLLGQAVVLALLTMITPIEVVYAKETLDAGDVGFGLLLAAWGIGMVAGSALFARERDRTLRALIVASTLLMVAGYFGMALAPGLLAACVASAVGGLGNGVQWVAVLTAVQEATDERYQARVAGLLEAMLTAAPGVGFLVGGSLTALLSPRTTFAVSGAGVLAVLVLGALLLRPPARRPVVA
jgi:MFS family permease